MQPGTRISFGISKVLILSYLILYYLILYVWCFQRKENLALLEQEKEQEQARAREEAQRQEKLRKEEEEEEIKGPLSPKVCRRSASSDCLRLLFFLFLEL